MNIQVHDFPSDPIGETYGVRGELAKCLQRAAISATGLATFKAVLSFTIGKIKEIEAAQAAPTE